MRSGVEGADNVGQLRIDGVVVELAGTGVAVAAAAVLEAELADIDVGALVDDGLADHDGGVLLAEAPGHMDGDLRLGIEGIDHEAVARMDDLLIAQIQHDDLVVDLRDTLKLGLEFLGLGEVEIHALLDGKRPRPVRASIR